MSLKNVIRELKEIRDDITGTKTRRRRGKSHIAPESSATAGGDINHRSPAQERNEDEIVSGEEIRQSAWANLPPELLGDVIQRVESKESAWPGRRDVVACGSVCRSWRNSTKEIVKIPEQCGCLTFPISLKQPGPREAPIQCFIRRERATATYRLYLGLTPALSGDTSKLLLAAKRIRRATCTDFYISFVGSEFLKTSNTYAGRLRSNFFGTKFKIYDGHHPHSSVQANCHSQRKVQLVQVFPWGSDRNDNVATVAYELNVLRTRGPRRMCCTMHSIPLSSIQEGGTAPTPMEFEHFQDEQSSKESKVSVLKTQHEQSLVELRSASRGESVESISGRSEPLVLKNKAPRWHEQLQCWCLNFKGRVTVASVKNFQLVAAAEASESVPAEEQEKVILQFGKIGKDIFTMDYRYPLSAFQAFTICLSSFDTKPACE